tara:strand:- start:79 stop:453 length:375 start_codon:yes stop_codon:yes gene_type:complete
MKNQIEDLEEITQLLSEGRERIERAKEIIKSIYKLELYNEAESIIDDVNRLQFDTEEILKKEEERIEKKSLNDSLWKRIENEISKHHTRFVTARNAWFNIYTFENGDRIFAEYETAKQIFLITK